jgi:hypothetical protein
MISVHQRLLAVRLRRLRWLSLLLALLSGAASAADDSATAGSTVADPDLPQPFDTSTLQKTLVASPFSRVVDYSGTLQLTGIASVNGKPIATLLDKQTKQHIVVSDEVNAKGWRLAMVTDSGNIKEASVQLAIGSELVTLFYTPPVAPQKSMASNNNSSSSGGRYPTDEEAIRKDENGNAYVRGSVYLPEADRERYYNGGLSREAHDKFREVIRDNREKMFGYSPEQRAAFAKKVFDHVDAEDKARQGK